MDVIGVLGLLVDGKMKSMKREGVCPHAFVIAEGQCKSVSSLKGRKFHIQHFKPLNIQHGYEWVSDWLTPFPLWLQVFLNQLTLNLRSARSVNHQKSVRLARNFPKDLLNSRLHSHCMQPGVVLHYGPSGYLFISGDWSNSNKWFISIFFYILYSSLCLFYWFDSK